MFSKDWRVYPRVLTTNQAYQKEQVTHKLIPAAVTRFATDQRRDRGGRVYCCRFTAIIISTSHECHARATRTFFFSNPPADGELSSGGWGKIKFVTLLPLRCC